MKSIFKKLRNSKQSDDSSLATMAGPSGSSAPSALSGPDRPSALSAPSALFTSMAQHALGILTDAQSWEWPNTQRLQGSGKTGSKFEAISASLLYWLILESQNLGGPLLDQFWLQLGKCHPCFKENIQKLRVIPFVSEEFPQQSSNILFEGVKGKVNFRPVLQMAAEYFTHLGVALRNPGGLKSAIGTPHSVSDFIATETENLLREMDNGDRTFGTRRQAVLKALSLRRDGVSCPLTGDDFISRGVKPSLAHVIPHAVHAKPDTLKCIAMFAGDATRNEVMRNLNQIGNAMNLEMNAHAAYDDFMWGIEAREEENGEVKYIYRNIPHDARVPGHISLKEGDEILFGRGPDGMQLNKGPLPRLCNLQLAVARVLNMSAAADIILELEDEADDGDFPQSYVASERFCAMLDAKLLLSGALVL